MMVRRLTANTLPNLADPVSRAQTAETINNVFGTTTMPFNTALTPGGSTGGEGALIALKGSIMGFGTDIAGSVRMPALCCGIYALKPSVGRLPTMGCTTSVPGQESVAPNFGTMARCVVTSLTSPSALLTCASAQLRRGTRPSHVDRRRSEAMGARCTGSTDTLEPHGNRSSLEAAIADRDPVARREGQAASADREGFERGQGSID